MKIQIGKSHENTRRKYTPSLICLLALLLTACASTTPPAQQPEPVPTTNVETSHAPVILRVEERTEDQNGQLLLVKDFYFSDTQGDATIILNKLVATDPAGLSVTIADDPIVVPVAEQKREGQVTTSIGCPQVLIPFSLTIEDRIRDAAGNLSNPVTITFNCPANPPNSLPSLIFMVVLGLALLAGYRLVSRKRPGAIRPAILSILLLFLSLFPATFLFFILHEGGHALANLILGGTVSNFYVHPFTFMGMVKPITDPISIWTHALGYITNLLVSSVIFLLFWKRRSVANLPLVMLLPLGAILQGLLMFVLDGDIANLMRISGLPAIPFMVLGLVLFCAGIFLLLALFPLFGLTFEDRNSLLIVPAAFFLQSLSGWLVAHWFVPASTVGRQYLEGAGIIASANTLAFLLPSLAGLFAVLYFTLFRKLAPRLPAWLQTGTVSLTWKDLRLPAILWVVSVVIGLIIVI